jgi:hypothetical protein
MAAPAPEPSQIWPLPYRPIGIPTVPEPCQMLPSAYRPIGAPAPPEPAKMWPLPYRAIATKHAAGKLRLDDPEFDGSKHGHRAVGCAHFGEDARYLIFYRALGGSQSGGDLFVCHAAGE